MTKSRMINPETGEVICQKDQLVKVEDGKIKYAGKKILRKGIQMAQIRVQPKEMEEI